jgi:hypothetical protein
MSISRIPYFVDHSQEGMKNWFSEMSSKGLLFHPDDSPDDIVSIKTGKEIFSSDEAVRIKETLKIMFSIFNDDVYEAAYPYFMQSLGIQE